MGEERASGRGPRLLRALAIILLAIVVLWLLFTEVFPRVERHLEDPTLGTFPTVTLAGRG